MRKDVFLLAVAVTSLRGSASLAGALDFWVWQLAIQARLCCEGGVCTSPGRPLTFHIQASADCTTNKAFDKDTHYINQTGTEYPDTTKAEATIYRLDDMQEVAHFPASDAQAGVYLLQWKVDDEWETSPDPLLRDPRDDDPATGYECLYVVACPTLKITGPKRTCPGTAITLAFEGCGEDLNFLECAKWSAPTGTPQTGDGATFTTSFQALNEHTVTVTVGGIPASYTVIVDPPAVTLTVARTTPAPDQPLVRGQNAVYAVTANPSLIDPEFQWEFYEGNGSEPAVSRIGHSPNNFTWSGTMVAGGYIRVYLRDTACPKEDRYPDDGVFVVAPRNWAQEPPKVANFSPAIEFSLGEMNINGHVDECSSIGFFVFDMRQSVLGGVGYIEDNGSNAGYRYISHYDPQYDPSAATNPGLNESSWRSYMNNISPAWSEYAASNQLIMSDYFPPNWEPSGSPHPWSPSDWFKRVVEVHEGLAKRRRNDSTSQPYYWSHWLFGRAALGYGQDDWPATGSDPKAWVEMQVSKSSTFATDINTALEARYLSVCQQAYSHPAVPMNIDPDNPPGLWDGACNMGIGCFVDDSCGGFDS